MRVTCGICHQESEQVDRAIATLTAENERLREHIGASGIAYLEQLRARVAELEEALGRIVNTYGVGLGTELLSEARAALARPTPAPEGEQG